MSPAQTNPKANSANLQLTQREIEIIAKAWRCISDIKDGIPQVDSKKLAAIGNYASADSARHSWKPIEMKLAAMNDTAEDPTADVTDKGKIKATPRKRKANTDISDEDIEESPTKKTRTPLKSKVKTEGGRDIKAVKKTPTRKSGARKVPKHEMRVKGEDDSFKDEGYAEGEA
ncbi:hypothetical protein GGR54DRAFT_348971 [Hypoxylon sp. NC1633]|nr:hypothetical protein GGR54DRAFT_348971 [Hypoxylon sp. NC1633]